MSALEGKTNMNSKVELFLSEARNHEGRRLLFIKGGRYTTLSNGTKIYRFPYKGFRPDVAAPVSHREVK